jgi:hypothetical protein
MLKDRIIRIRLKKYFHEQKPICYVGKCTAFNDYWVVLDGRCIMIARNQPNNIQLDPKPSAMVIPRDNVESIRVLPDNFDVDNISFTTEGQQLRMVVDGKRDCFIGELGEG